MYIFTFIPVPCLPPPPPSLPLPSSPLTHPLCHPQECVLKVLTARQVLEHAAALSSQVTGHTTGEDIHQCGSRVYTFTALCCRTLNSYRVSSHPRNHRHQPSSHQPSSLLPRLSLPSLLPPLSCRTSTRNRFSVPQTVRYDNIVCVHDVWSHLKADSTVQLCRASTMSPLEKSCITHLELNYKPGPDKPAIPGQPAGSHCFEFIS